MLNLKRLFGKTVGATSKVTGTQAPYTRQSTKALLDSGTLFR